MIQRSTLGSLSSHFTLLLLHLDVRKVAFRKHLLPFWAKSFLLCANRLLSQYKLNKEMKKQVINS